MSGMPCTHPARVTGEDGKTRCLTCGKAVAAPHSRAGGGAYEVIKPKKKAGKDKTSEA